MAKISKVVGIDLGTTNSVIAMIGADNKTVVCNTDAQKRRTFPSVIVWDKKSESIQCGQRAFNRRGSTPEPTTSIKRHMGDANYRVQVGDKELSPVEVSAEILREMKNQMQEYLKTQPGCENYVVDRAIITIPAYFKSEAASDTTKAGELAGLEVVRTLQEPSASSAYYCWKKGIEDGIFMVYDLGGGTFDVSIVRYAAGMADVVGISGNNYLGGDTFDELLAKMILETLQEEYTLDLRLSDDKDLQRFTKLKLAAEVIKKSLSSQEEYYYTNDGIFQDQDGASVNLAISVSRQEFEDLIAPTLQGTIEKCKEALAEAEKQSVTLDAIDGIILVGGSTHIPFVQEFVRRNFCDPSLPLHTKEPMPLRDEPDMAVGFGAAVAAAGGYSEITMSDTPDTFSATETTYAVEVQPPIGVIGKSTVSGIIRAVHGALPTGIEAKVSKADGSYSNTFPIADDGVFRFAGLPAPSEDEPYFCEVTASGAQVTTFGFNAAAAVIKPPPTTLSHTLCVELTDSQTGKRYLHPLMKKGTNLPASEEYKFRTNSEYSAVIRIFEDNTHLCDIRLTFENPVPVGSPVEIRLQIDEKSTKYVYATAAGASQNAVMEPPPLEPVTEGDLRGKLGDFDSKLKVSSLQDQILGNALKRGELKQRTDEIAQAIAENDNMRAKEAFDELSKMVDEFGGGRLTPPEDEFRALVQECLGLIHSEHDSKPELIEKTNTFQQCAAEYYVQRDQDGVTQIYSELQAWRDYLKPEESNQRPPQWMVAKYLCNKIREDMRTAEENSDLQTEMTLKKQAESEKAGDENTINRHDQALGPWVTDEEAIKVIVELRPIMERWERYAQYKIELWK
jgi:molecular chaperone DnaK